ncbi:hypothetical protein GGS21DRAFT_493053 [Xylaria nigripes]|nr:hypothetical protein GGS21DRAFT_493053 [Xylaria nigripes]
MFSFGSRKEWRSQINAVYDILEANECLPASNWSKLHVKCRDLSLKQVKKVSARILQYGTAFDALGQAPWYLERERTADLNSMIKTNEMSYDSIWRQVRTATDLHDVAAWMNGMGGVIADPYQIWNFWPLVSHHQPPFYEGHRRTKFVEYRFGMKHNNKIVAKSWIDFVCLFFECSLEQDLSDCTPSCGEDGTDELLLFVLCYARKQLRRRRLVDRDIFRLNHFPFE